MIIQCQDCSKKFQVPDSVAGKRIKCPACGKPIDAIPLDVKPESPSQESARVQSVPRQPKQSAELDSNKSIRDFGAAALPSQKRQSQKKTAPNRTSRRPSANRKSTKARAPQPTEQRRRPRPKHRVSDNYTPTDDFDDAYDWDESSFEDYGDPFGDSSSQGGSRQSRRESTNRGAATVGLGLTMIGWTVATMYSLLLLFVLSLLVKSPELSKVAAIVCLVGLFAGAFTLLAGHILCIVGATDTRAKGLALATLACGIVHFVLSLLKPEINRQPVVLDLSLMLRAIIPFATLVLFLLFVKQMAKSVRYNDSVIKVNIIFAGWCIIVALASAIVLTRGQVPSTITLIMMLIIPFGLVALSIMQIITVLGLGKELRKRGPKQSSSAKRTRRRAS